MSTSLKESVQLLSFAQLFSRSKTIHITRGLWIFWVQMHEKLFLNIFFGGDIVNKQSKRAFGFKQKKQILLVIISRTDR